MKNYAYISMASSAYFPGAYILGKMLKEAGCEYPLHLWVDGLIQDVPKKLFDVAVVHPELRQDIIEIDRSRLLLSLYQKFDKVFWLGTDCYPVENLDLFFDDCDEAIFWKDVPLGQKFEPSGFGLPEETLTTTFSPQGDTFILDLQKCKDALEHLHHFNVNHEEYYKFGHRDQAAFRAAWAKAELKQFSYSEDVVDWLTVPYVYLHQGRDGKSVAIVHRLGSKFPVMFTKQPSFLPMLPHEQKVWETYREFTGSEAFTEYWL